MVLGHSNRIHRLVGRKAGQVSYIHARHTEQVPNTQEHEWNTRWIKQVKAAEW